MPMAVLINSDTAGCGELFACDLKDFGKAFLIGEKTAGIGLVLGDAACYVLGTAWFVFQMQCELGYALSVCVYPFIVLDLAKIVVSCIVGALLRKRLVQAGVLKLKEA